MNKKYAIAISGKHSSGKSTLAEYLENDLRSYNLVYPVVTPLAEKLKQCATQYFGWDGNKDIKGRQLLINLARTAVKYQKEIWCWHAHSLFEQEYLTHVDGAYAIQILPDWRFVHEYHYFYSSGNYDGVFCVRIDRPGLETSMFDSDSSENELDNFEGFDYHISNTTLERLGAASKEVAQLALQKFQII